MACIAYLTALSQLRYVSSEPCGEARDDCQYSEYTPKSFARRRARPIGILNCFLNNEVVHKIATECSRMRRPRSGISGSSDGIGSRRPFDGVVVPKRPQQDCMKTYAEEVRIVVPCPHGLVGATYSSSRF